jgi:hypothetical protein
LLHFVPEKKISEREKMNGNRRPGELFSIDKGEIIHYKSVFLPVGSSAADFSFCPRDG